MDMTWERLILLSLLVRNDQKTLSRPNGCQPLVNEPEHHVSSSIIIVAFLHILGHPVGVFFGLAPFAKVFGVINCQLRIQAQNIMIKRERKITLHWPQGKFLSIISVSNEEGRARRKYPTDTQKTSKSQKISNSK